MIVQVTQSNYMPWWGWFSLAAAVDTLVLLDCVQYTRRDWRNRNRIVTAGGSKWLSVPVKVSDHRCVTIAEVEVVPGWTKAHVDALAGNGYPWWRGLSSDIKKLFDELASLRLLSDVNERSIRWFLDLLEIPTAVAPQRMPIDCDSASDRLARLAALNGATTYVSGSAARDYLDEQPFKAKGIRVEYFEFLATAFGEPSDRMSILDSLLRIGPDELQARVRAASHSAAEQFE